MFLNVLFNICLILYFWVTIIFSLIIFIILVINIYFAYVCVFIWHIFHLIFTVFLVIFLLKLICGVVCVKIILFAYVRVGSYKISLWLIVCKKSFQRRAFVVLYRFLEKPFRVSFQYNNAYFCCTQVNICFINI